MSQDKSFSEAIGHESVRRLSISGMRSKVCPGYDSGVHTTNNPMGTRNRFIGGIETGA
jgi:hypothetical protein